MNEEDVTTVPAHPSTVLSVNDKDALRALRHAVAEKGPDHVYKAPVEGQTACVYVWEIDGKPQPQCIVGCALHYLGVPLDVMAQEGCNEVNVWSLASKIAPRYILETRAVDILRAAQVVQDSALKTGCTCSVCVESAKAADGSSTWGNALVAAEKWAAAFVEYSKPPTAPAPTVPDTVPAAYGLREEE